MCMICPVIQELLSLNKKAVISAISLASPTRFIGLLFPIASFFSGVLNNLPANGVSVSDGAIQLIRAFGAYSLAIARVNPSIAPLEALTVA